MKEHISPRATRRTRRIAARAQERHIDDPYKSQRKPSEPSVCASCGAVFHEGRWRWMMRPEGAAQVTCQACHRQKDNYPAGEVILSGAYIRAHKDELLGRTRHNEEVENKEHPLNRIISREVGDDKTVLTTTDIHLPRRIGEALRHAYHGSLDFKYDEDSYFIRVHWTREA